MRNDRERLLDVLEAVERIDRYARKGRETFERDELVQTWFVHNLQIIGESCRAISPELRDAHPEIPWSKIIGMRNILVHDYFGIDTDVVWEAVQRDVPRLEEQIRALADGLKT
jgi:uncharacterized protein with HEPN domain